MTQPTRSIFRIWLPLVVGLVAVCGLLFAVRPAAVASFPEEQPADTFVLWLAPPETPSAPDPWPLAAEAHRAGWLARSEVVEERLATIETQGRIVAFEPLPGRVGFTFTSPDGLPPEVRRWPEVARITAPDEVTPEALAAWWQQGLDAAGVARASMLSAQQATTLTLNLGQHSLLVSGSTPRPESIALSLTRDDEVIASGTATPFPDGSGSYLYVTTLYASVSGGGCYLVIQPGDVLEAVQAGQTSLLSVPLLTALADRDTASVYGQAPASTTLEVYFYRHDDPGDVYQQTVTATATGDYRADFGGLTPVAPRDYGYVFHADGAGNRVYARYNVPFLRVGVESNYMDGVVAPCTTVTATLHDHTGALRSQNYGCSLSAGAFSVYFDADSQVSDTVVFTAAGQVVSMTVPALTVHPDPTSDTVSGETAAGAAVQVDLYEGPLEYEHTSAPPSGDPDHSLSVTATLTGAYTAGFADVAAGDYGAVYVTNGAGHQAYRRFAAPFLRARLGDYRLTGQVNDSGKMTVTVWGSSGVPRDVHFVWPYDSGRFYDDDWEGRLRLLAGDQVIVTAQDGEETGLTLPQLTAQADLERSTVRGQAPPNSSLRVEVSLYWYPSSSRVTGGGGPDFYTLWVTSTASGVYTADLSSLTTFQPGYKGAVFHVNSAGHEAYLEFSVPVVPVVRVQSGSNYVAGTLPSGSQDVFVTLRDASDQVKAMTASWVNYWGSFGVYLYQDGQPAIIEPGDTVEVATGDPLVVITVPTLTMQADLAANTLSGQAPPDAPLIITWHGGDAWDALDRIWTVTSTVAGDYSLDLSGEVDLEGGDRCEVAWTDENGNVVWTAYRAPRLEAALGSSTVGVAGPLHSPLTLTMLAADSTPLYTRTAIFNDSGWSWFYLYNQSSSLPLQVEAGQTLIADLVGEVMTVTLPHLTAQADSLADTVSGKAPPGARLMVSVYSGYYWQNYWPVTATITGTYSADFDGLVNLTSNSSGGIAYLHPDGHRVTLDYAVPYIKVTLGTAFVSGVAPGPGVVTITLRDDSGGFKGSAAYTPWYNGTFYVYLTDAQQQSVSVTSGDAVVAEAAGNVVTFTVPALTASFDPQTGILAGTAPAGTWLHVLLGGGSRQVQVGPGGTYAMDWNDMSLQPDEQGHVYLTDDLGNQVWLDFTIPHYGIYLPLVLRDI